MCESAKSVIVEHIYGASVEPVKITIEINSKGYSWEVSCAGSDMAEILSKIRAADAALKAEFGAT
jgi:hypothetical protein